MTTATQFNQTVMLADALRKRGVEMELLIFPDEVHDFLLHRTWKAGVRSLGALHRNTPGNTMKHHAARTCSQASRAVVPYRNWVLLSK